MSSAKRERADTGTSSAASVGGSLEERLRAQLEYYFGDANLRRDGHMAKLIGGADGAMRGWAPLDDVLDFARAKRLLDDLEAAPAPEAKRAKKGGAADGAAGRRRAAAVACLATSSLLEVDGARVRRTTPFVRADAETVAERTVYVEPLDPSADDHDAVTARFAAYGAVVHVSLPTRRAEGGAPAVRRGFGFVEFDSRAAAAAAIARADGAEPRPGAPPTTVVSRIEWAAIRARWNDLRYNPTTAQARRRDNQRAPTGRGGARAGRGRGRGGGATKIGPPTGRR